MNNFRGEIAALSAACLWAIATAIIGQVVQKITPFQVGLLKGAIAIALIFTTLLVRGEPLREGNLFQIGLLILSGAISLGLGDLADLYALNKLGARLTLLMETLVPPLVAILALVFLEERLSATKWCGILLTILGVAWVMSERTSAKVIEVKNWQVGFAWCLVAEFAKASSAVLSRAALAESTITPLWSSFFRLSAGTVTVFVLFLFRSARKRPSESSDIPKETVKFSLPLKAIASIFLAAFIGNYLGIWLQQTSFKFAQAGIVQTLLSTSPLFVLPIAAAMGDRVSFRTVLGACLAVIGISLQFSL